MGQAPDCSNQVNGYTVPDPVACDIFYTCRDGVAITGICPKPLVFDPETARCVDASFVTCPSVARR